MSLADRFLDAASTAALALLGLALLLTVVRIARGPTLPDRILGLDTLTVVAVGFILVFGIRTGLTLSVDIAVALGLVGFLATVAFARFVAARGQGDGKPDDRERSAS